MALFSLSRQQEGWSRWRIVRHYLVRGILLIILQLIVENRVWGLGESIGATYFGVLYALGGVMMVGSLLLFLPMSILMSFSLALLVANEALLPKTGSGFTEYAPLLRLMLLPGYTHGIYVLYPLLPWLGVAGLGIAYGRWLKRDALQAYRGTVGLGSVALIGFMVLRALNGFGNIRPMVGSDWMAFFNLVKYPPSLTFLLLTLGVNLLLLSLMAGLSRREWRLLSGLAVYGRVPLFFYLIHLYLYAIIGSLISPQGMPMARMYPYWLLGLALLFPLSWGYGRFKQARPAESLWRLL